MKLHLTIAVLFSLLFIISGVLQAQPYAVPANSRDNTLVLTIENSGEMSVGEVTVRVVSPPSYLHFTPEHIALPALPLGSAEDVSFSFAVDRSAPMEHTDKIFIEVRAGTQRWTREISLTYLPPVSYHLAQNFPNPFNPTTTIQYQLPTDGHVTLEIYNVLGEKVRKLVEGIEESGYHEVEWDATNTSGSPVGNGVYFYRLTVQGTKGSSFLSVKKMLVVK